MASGSKTSGLFRGISASIAFILWGGWTYYANQEAPTPQRVTSSLLQGIASFVITLLMVFVITWLFDQFSSRLLQIALPAVITVGFTGSFQATMHYMVGTPNIVLTIAPALTVAFLFCLFTAYQLQRTEVIEENSKHD